MGCSDYPLSGAVRGTALVFAFLLFALGGRGQSIECGSGEPGQKEVVERENRIQQLRLARSGKRLQADFTFVPIRFNIVHRSDGTGRVTLAEVNTVLANLNANYVGAGIQFYLAGATPHYISSDAFYEYDQSEEEALTKNNDIGNAINVYVVGTLTTESGSTTGYSYYPTYLANSNRLFIRGNRFADFRTLTHELGHYFNLLHTFHNNDSQDVSLRELVTRGPGANCTTAGDLLCDTPADPYGLPNSTVVGCSYTGTARDANNTLFTPTLNNMMSYYYACGNEFTPGQYRRIQDGLLLRQAASNQYTLNYPPSTAVPVTLEAKQEARGVAVAFTGVASDKSGFIIERSTSENGPYVPIAGLGEKGTSYLDSTVVANTLYYYRVRVAGGIQYSTADTAMVRQFYCKPSYSSACSPIMIADFILRKDTTTLISKLNTGCGVDSYSDYSAITARVASGQTYRFTARAVSAEAGSYFPQHLAIWVDVNRNGTFEADERLYQSSTEATMAPELSGTFTLPATSVSGPTRLRVRSGYRDDGPVSDPCGEVQYGEAEDYTLLMDTASPPVDKTQDCSLAVNRAAATLSGDTTLLAGGKATLRIDFTGITPMSIRVGGVEYSNLTQSPLLVNVFPDKTTTYTIESVSNACGAGVASGSAKVSINESGALTTLSLSSGQVCRGSTIQVPFAGNGAFAASNVFKVQLSDALGNNFVDIPTTGTTSPLTASVPAGMVAGTGYKVRVVASNPGVVGEPSGAFAIAPAPTATLSSTAASADSLSIRFTGKAPWTVKLSDESVHTTSSTPLVLRMTPVKTTTYTLSTMEDGCTQGAVSGSATITVADLGEACRSLCVPMTITMKRR